MVIRGILKEDICVDELSVLWGGIMSERICSVCGEKIGYNREFWYQEGEPFAYHKNCLEGI